MCFDLLKKLFGGETNLPPIQPQTLPHPPEAPDYTKTVENADITQALNEWMVAYQVPEEYRTHWTSIIVIRVTDTISYPAQTWEVDGIRHLDIRPEWLNPGVIAHEQAHNSYALLTEEQRTEFSMVYNSLKNTDPYIKLLYSQNTYGLTNDIEGYAEIYRFIAEKLPSLLKSCYPKLF